LDHLAKLVVVAFSSWRDRPDELKYLDQAREAQPDWFQSNQMLGAFCNVDRYVGDLAGLRDQVPYFKDLGITYLHLMPFFDCPKENSDGGYRFPATAKYARTLAQWRTCGRSPRTFALLGFRWLWILPSTTRPRNMNGQRKPLKGIQSILIILDIRV
jgi:hypothetical protein